MIICEREKAGRHSQSEKIDCDFVVAGGGLSGICASISAARAGSRVTLIQDRPVLGGNASSEVRLWALGATSHMGNNNRWAREDGIIGELLIENMHRNKEGNPVIFDAMLLDKVLAEPNIRLLLNTTVIEVRKKSEKTIDSLEAFNAINDTLYFISAPLFCDCTGDGAVAYKAGAAYRMGGEDAEEFSEGFSPSEAFGELLGHSMTFYTKKCDRKVNFVAPDFALKDIKLIPKYETITPDKWGCNYWWFEYGGEMDTVHDSEEIKMELTKLIYGVWNYIKNSGKFPEADNLTLEWVANIPGKRESRRFIGKYMLSQQDIVFQHRFDDAVAYGGWAIDLHPAKGVFSALPSCSQYHSKGIYSIPLRCFIPKDINNLFIAGRIISASHVAFGSTRVMATCGLGGQAVGEAAALCKCLGCGIEDLLKKENLIMLQQRLNKKGQSIPFVPINQDSNLLSGTQITADSTLSLSVFPEDGSWIDLEYGAGQLLPLKKNTRYSFEIKVCSSADTSLKVDLVVSGKVSNFTPDFNIDSKTIEISKGGQIVRVAFDNVLSYDQYGFVLFRANPNIKLAASSMRLSGVLSVFNKFNLKVGNTGKQNPPEGSGFDSFEFWCPDRRPAGKNLALKITPALDDFNCTNLLNGFTRPFIASNAWVAEQAKSVASVSFRSNQSISISRLTLYFDSDFDHPMESVQWGHPENDSPFCVRNFKVFNESGGLIAEVKNNYKSIVVIDLDSTIETSALKFEFEQSDKNIPISLFGIFAE